MTGTPSPGARVLLLPLAGLYALGHRIRRVLYDTGMRRRYRPDVRTVSVGNITAGGTGKSPLVELLASCLAEDGLKVVVVRRSGARGPFGGDFTDEERAFSENVPNVVQVADEHKARAARKACEFEPDVLLVDDGFQTLSLERDLDVVTIDAGTPFGNGLLLPAGTLRESPRALRRAGAMVLTHCGEVPDDRREEIRRKLREYTDAPLFEASYRPVGLDALSGHASESLFYLEGKRVFAFCGIGRPRGFLATLERLGCEVVGARVFRDHHVYSEDDITGMEAEAAHVDAEAIVTTQKDAMRMRDRVQPGSDIYCVKIRLDIHDVKGLIRLVRGEAQASAGSAAPEKG